MLDFILYIEYAEAQAVSFVDKTRLYFSLASPRYIRRLYNISQLVEPFKQIDLDKIMEM